MRTLQPKSGLSMKIRILTYLMVGIFLLTNSNLSYAFTSDIKAGPVLASAFVDIDTDGDQLGDTWERNYFGSIDVVNEPYGDFDNDGYTNLWEYQHGTDPTDPGDPNFYIVARNNALGFLKAMMDKRVTSGKRILYSYIDTDGNTEGYSWTYDDALAILAFEERGEWQRAKEVLDAFIWFQDRDPIGDGRIRRGYWATKPIDDLHVGDCNDWITNANAEASNQAIGDMAFMILAALRYHDHIGGADPYYLNFAKKLGDWIYNNAKSDAGAGGYNMARRDNELANPANFDRKSTENNIDVYVAFIKLYEALNDHDYRTYALHAKNYVLAMWNAADGMFWTGTIDDGVTINGGTNSDVRDYDGVNPTSGQPEDPSAWGFLTFGETAKYGAGVNWVENNCKVENMDGFAFGYDFNASRDGIWFEGMSHISLSYQMLGDDTQSNKILDVIMQAQDLTTGGIMCASHDGVSTSFNGWTLSDDLHVAPTAWLIFAVDAYNPFWSQAITGPVPYEGGYNAAGDKYIFLEPWAEASTANIAPAQDGTVRAMVDFIGTGGDDKGTFDVSDDGTIVKYEWDFDGKGTYDWSSTAAGDVQYWYTEAGAHLARFRVTNDKGYVSSRGVSINVAQADLGAGVSSPVTSGVSASAINGAAPLAIMFTGAGSDADGYVAGYEWDFNGDGEYDSYSNSSGNITHTYHEVGTYAPTFRITDNDGLTDSATLAIEVFDGSTGPTASAGINAAAGVAPHMVEFYAIGSTGDITAYEWDFDGDSVYDWSASQETVATHIYGEPGTYEARLKVTDTGGISDTDTVKVRVEFNAGLTPPTAIGSVDVSNGIVPFTATFTHSSSVGIITKYEWDFRGDKEYNWSSSSGDDKAYLYTRPGYYLAALRATEDNGLTDMTYLPMVVMGPDQAGAVFASYIKSPKDGESIYGNSVSIIVEIMPYNKNQNAQLQHRHTSPPNEPWADLGAPFAYPYRTTTDATIYPDGTYEARVPINSIPDKAKTTLFAVDSVNWDIFEEVTPDGKRIKKVRVEKDEDMVIELVDGTKVEIKSGTLPQDDIMTVTTPNGSGTLVDDGTNSILYHRDFTFTNTTTFDKPITIVIPYDDADDDGIVDGLNVREEELKLYMYDEVKGEWVEMPDYTVYPDENYVAGTITHLSVFGLGNLGIGAAAVGGGGGIGSMFGGGGGRSCFIATATFGTPMAEEVQSLRYFRDRHLLTNRPGLFAVDMYEKYSPPVARAIEKSKFLKGMVRYHLRPVITFARLANVFIKWGQSPPGLDDVPGTVPIITFSQFANRFAKGVDSHD